METSVSLVMKFIALLLLLFVPTLRSQQVEQIKKTITFLFRETSTNGFHPIGTGFWVGAKSSDSNRYVTLVTAKHVVWGTNGVNFDGLYYRINNGTNEAKMVRIPPSTFIVHSDPTVDIVCIGAPLEKDQSLWNFFPLEAALSKSELKEKGIEEGEDVFFAGLFSTFYGKARNTPIFRFGKLAMLSDEKIPWVNGPTDLYLMETQSYPGNSGSPVFFHIKSLRKGTFGADYIVMAGIMTGYFGEGVIRPIVEAKLHSVDAWNLGIAAVTPAHYLREVMREWVKAMESASRSQPTQAGVNP